MRRRNTVALRVPASPAPAIACGYDAMRCTAARPFFLALALVFAVCVGAAYPGAGLAATADDITNYRRYSALLSSSGQPTRAQLSQLGGAGFERVVFLAFSDHATAVAQEDRLVRDAGLDYIQIPVSWSAPSRADFETFAAVLASAPAKATLVHCELNFRASSFVFLYRVIHEGVPLDEALDDLNAVWIPNETWRRFLFSVLEANGIAPECDACLWETR
jgi:protein tyrosine phosphatase (PTP) superfamily phosphohydrolase (DUF442 family)